MQQYFVNKNQVQNKEVRINGQDALHISKVMRMKYKDKILVSDEISKYLCELITIKNDEVIAEVLEEITSNTELKAKITIAHGLPKGDKLELVIQKGTELGASGFIALNMERSISKWTKEKVDKKIERLNKIAKEAGEQSKRLVVPKVTYISKVEELCNKYDKCKYKFVAYEGSAGVKPLESLVEILPQATNDDEILIIVGPEGGISEKEIKLLIENNFKIISLGNRILRSETAPLYILSVMGYLLESK